MKIGIIGSGDVAQTLGNKLIARGNDVILGTRDPSKLDDKKMLGAMLREWKSQNDRLAKVAHLQAGGRSR
jgi:predicted dinucleotide-binding enzyme